MLQLEIYMTTQKLSGWIKDQDYCSKFRQFRSQLQLLSVYVVFGQVLMIQTFYSIIFEWSTRRKIKSYPSRQNANDNGNYFPQISDIAEEEIQKLEKKYKEGNRVRVRILGLRHLEGLATGVLKVFILLSLIS